MNQYMNEFIAAEILEVLRRDGFASQDSETNYYFLDTGSAGFTVVQQSTYGNEKDRVFRVTVSEL